MGVLSWLSHMRRGWAPELSFGADVTGGDADSVDVEQLRSELDRLTNDAVNQRQEASRLSQQLTREQRNAVLQAQGHVLRTNRTLQHLETRLAVLERAMVRQSARTAALITRVEQATRIDSAERAVIERLVRITAGDTRIIVGPWTGDRGVELTYWVPFVRWVAGRFHVTPERLHIMTSGGPRCWYGDITSNYIDLLSCCSRDELASSRGRTSPFRGFDRMVLHRARQRLGGGRIPVMHPMLLDRLFGSPPGIEVPLERVLRCIVPRRIAPLPLTGFNLPSHYIAAWFPFSAAFPDVPANRAIAADMLTSLAEDGDVVLLDTSPPDRERLAAGHRRIHVIDHLVPADRLLDLQTAVIAGAEACVGSASALSYVASLCGVRSLTLYSERASWHVRSALVDHLMDRFSAAPMTELDVANLPLVADIVQAGAQDERRDTRPVN